MNEKKHHLKIQEKFLCVYEKDARAGRERGRERANVNKKENKKKTGYLHLLTACN